MEDSVLQADAELFLTEFGEQITYRPFGGTARTILAVVDRAPPESIPESGNGQQQSLVIEVANRSTSTDDDDVGGIGSDTIDTGTDQVDIEVRVGKTAESRPLGRLLNHDAGMLRLEVR